MRGIGVNMSCLKGLIMSFERGNMSYTYKGVTSYIGYINTFKLDSQ